MLQLVGVSKSFQGVVAVQPLDLTVAEGRTTVLIGPSGCGKSTLLRLMVGLIEPDNGQVLFDGVPITRSSARQLRQRIGFVVQDGGLFPHLSARENITLLARHLGWPASRLKDRVTQLAELTHFPLDKLAFYPAQLSGGQRQRVSLMRALMLDPTLLLLDEPFAALDPLIRYELQAELREIFRQLNKTVVLVTHDLTEAGYLGDEVVLMHAGRIVQQAPYRTLLEQPAEEFVTRFIQAQRPPETI